MKFTIICFAFGLASSQLNNDRITFPKYENVPYTPATVGTVDWVLSNQVCGYNFYCADSLCKEDQCGCPACCPENADCIGCIKEDPSASVCPAITPSKRADHYVSATAHAVAVNKTSTQTATPVGQVVTTATFEPPESVITTPASVDQVVRFEEACT